MFNERILWDIQRTISAEFTKYLLTHPEMDTQIPENAQIIFHLKGHVDFNTFSERIAASQREVNQPSVIVEIDDIAPALESRLINPHVEATR